VCGYDVWLISTRQRLNPQEFVVTLPTTADAPSGFLLAPGGQYWSLALDKRGRYRMKHACVFLVELGNGQSRCGVYDHRPVVCQAYPMFLWAARVDQVENALCPPDAWPEEARARWRASLQRERRHFDIYHEVVAHWNARVNCAGTAEQFSIFEYLAYVMNVYDLLGGLDRTYGADRVAAVEASWPDPTVQHATAPEGEWLQYLRQASRIIDHFYPYLATTGGGRADSEGINLGLTAD
jgi:Fe-S-cluster containining protein